MFCSNTDEKLPPLLLFRVISNWRTINGRRERLPLVAHVCVEGEIFDLRGENIANRGNLAVVQEERGNIAEILGRKDLPHQTFLCWFSLVKPLRILETISQTNFCFKPVGLL